MSKKKSLADLPEDELRWLLIEKRRFARHDRIEHYRRTGRVVMVSTDVESPSHEDWRTSTLTEEESAPPTRTRRKRVLDGVLLAVEISAVIGLIFILFNGLSLIRQLNREVVSALELPTLTPTPLIVAVVLPSGHTPPNSPGGAKFNDAEIPEHLRPLIQSLVNVSVPTPGVEQAIRIQIPALRVDAPVVQGDSWEQLKKGVGQHPGTPNPGQTGNLVLSAHNDIFGEIFRDLNGLKPGDQVTLYTKQRPYTYIVVENKIVAPTAVEALAATIQPTVTLISCFPYLIDDQRVVVTARLQSGLQ